MLQMVDNRNSDLLNGLHQVSFKITPLARGLNSLTYNPIYDAHNRHNRENTEDTIVNVSELVRLINVPSVSN